MWLLGFILIVIAGIISIILKESDNLFCHKKNKKKIEIILFIISLIIVIVGFIVSKNDEIH